LSALPGRKKVVKTKSKVKESAVKKEKVVARFPITPQKPSGDLPVARTWWLPQRREVVIASILRLATAAFSLSKDVA
jgi:hypothetical protein